jgi:hypothetical protein
MGPGGSWRNSSPRLRGVKQVRQDLWSDQGEGSGAMTIELSSAERSLRQKILDSYLSELRQAIAATKRDTSPLHDEENLIKALQRKLA